jgi:hypothetical protein
VAATAPVGSSFFKGLPFLDNSFSAERLLAAIACHRHLELVEEAPLNGDRARQLLLPAFARALRAQAGVNAPIGPTHAPDARQSSMLSAALRMIAGARPDWQPLVDLPVRIRIAVASNAISFSTNAYPQHVFLSEEAFSTRAELQEQLIHELCHNWMYLTEEFSKFSRESSRSLTLPSGTAGRSPSELIGATHVALTLVNWYAGISSRIAQERLRQLSQYASGCCTLLRSMPDVFTPDGQVVVAALLHSARRQNINQAS